MYKNMYLGFVKIILCEQKTESLIKTLMKVAKAKEVCQNHKICGDLQNKSKLFTISF